MYFPELFTSYDVKNNLISELKLVQIFYMELGSSLIERWFLHQPVVCNCVLSYHTCITSHKVYFAVVSP